MRKLIVHTLFGFFGGCLLARATAISPSGFVVPSSTVNGYATGGGPNMKTYLTNPSGGSIISVGNQGSASLIVGLSPAEQSATATASASDNPLDQSVATAMVSYYVVVAPVPGGMRPASGTVPVTVNTFLDTHVTRPNSDDAGTATAQVDEFGLELYAETDAHGTPPNGIQSTATTSQVIAVSIGVVNEIQLSVNAVAFGGETAIAYIDPTFTIEGSDAQSYELLYSPEITTVTVAPEPASFCLTGLLLLAGGAAWRRKKSA